MLQMDREREMELRQTKLTEVKGVELQDGKH